MMDYFQILCSALALLLAVYYYLTSPYKYWKKLGIAGPRPSLIFGNLKSPTLAQTSMSDTVKKMYDEYKNERVFGIYGGSTPILVINDLDLVKDVLIRDFSMFPSRGLQVFPKVDRLQEHLFQLEPEIWRPLRARLSPVFTSGKLKDMFPLVVECGEHLEKYLDTVTKQGEPVECREIAAKFTTDVIGTCAFGIDTNAIADEDSEFRRMGRELFAPSLKGTIREATRLFFPAVYARLGHLVQPRKATDFFTNVVMGTMNYREENDVVRPDFINMLLELKRNPSQLENIELTDSLLTSQAFVFFIAGFDTSSLTIAHALYELALQPDIQDKLRKEIRENLEENAREGKSLTYEQVKELKYLDAVFRETLRKHPIVPMLLRQVNTNYTFKDTKITIPKGTKIWIPVYGIHHDPDIYTKPKVFDPERFTNDGILTRHPMSYLAFGDGPRNCIGARFASYQSKVGLISILRNHKVEVCEKTTIPFKCDNRSLLLALKGGVMLKMSRAE
nr:probable cytochrome P450 6a14 [Megalopta genalis]XP_033326760.1 probable cytochrome P450 6a14 [Megalopta genalis]XP_033326761.1 probable cytochrome P450 6a14 [Megalopta genalis]